MSHSITAAQANAKSYRQRPREESYEIAATPSEWTPHHVACRLIEAFRVDRRMPKIERPKDPGSAHPTIEYSDEERADWELNHIDADRLPAKPDEIARMVEAFEWLQIIRDSDWNAQFALKNWARNESIKRKQRVFCRNKKIAIQTFLDRKDRALQAIAAHLVSVGMEVK